MNWQDKPIEAGQRLALNKLIGTWTKERDCRLWIIAQLLDRDELETTAVLTISEWQIIRNEAYPNWPDDDWTVSREFGVRAQGLVENYNEDVLGQLRLF